MNPSHALFTGFDGGGTKTKATVVASNGTVVYETHGAACNVVSLGVDGALANLLPMLDEIERSCPSYSAAASAITFGLAGVINADQERTRRLIQALEKRLPGQVITVVNDGHIAWYAGHAGLAGITIICGTGSVCYGVDDNGNVVVRGGLGHLLSDDGSGYQIGLKGIRSAIRGHTGIGPSTLLSSLLQSEFSLDDVDEAPLHIQDQQVVAAFARHVYDASVADDAVSIDIIRQAGKDLACLVDAAWRSGSFRKSPVRVTAVGGCFNNMSGLRDVFCHELAGKLERFEVCDSVWSPERGAAELARQTLRNWVA